MAAPVIMKLLALTCRMFSVYKHDSTVAVQVPSNCHCFIQYIRQQALNCTDTNTAPSLTTKHRPLLRHQ